MDLFSSNNDIEISTGRRRSRQAAHADYEGFVEKFKPKLTTDDCFTPPAVYESVSEWLRRNAPVGGRPIVRPFWPGGDYERFDYPPDCVVVDNPPFSIISGIARFYQRRRISFFLFAPHLTLFGAQGIDWTCLPIGAPVTYENGAVVNTSFISNLFGNLRIWGPSELRAAILAADKQATKTAIPKYEYPNNVITVGRVEKIIKRGIDVRIDGRSLRKIAALDAQRRSGKGIYGGGFLCSDAVADDLAAKDLAAKELATKREAIAWKLSEREMKIIETLE